MNDFEEVEESDLRNRYNRGDYIDKKEIERVKQILKKFENDRKFKDACLEASASAALISKRYARVAIVISIISLIISSIGLLQSLRSQ